MKKLGKPMLLVAMVIIAILFVLPIVLMYITSLKPEAEVLNPSSVIPHHVTLENYRNVLGWSEEAPFLQWLLNSIFISSTVTFLVMVFSSTAAFALTRLKVPGAAILITIIVVAMMIPAQLMMVPDYFILDKLHWLDTPWALIVPATAGGWGVFLMTQFMKGIPQALEEAAILDGCGSWGIFWNIMVPLCGPALATLAIFTFIGSWNDYVSPLIFLDSVKNYTLPVGIALYQSSYFTEYGRTLATGVLASTPLLLVYFFFQKQIVSSLATSGLKD